MTGPLIEPERRNTFCPIHPWAKVTRKKITQYAGGIRYISACSICGITAKTET